MDMCLHIVAGLRYRGRRVHPGPVVYLAFEGVEGFYARAEAMRIARPEFIEEYKFPFYLIPARANLVKDHAELLEDIRSHMSPADLPTLVVLDTLNRSIGGEENSAKDMGDYVNAATTIADEFKCAVIVVHHCGYDTSHARGSTVLGANTDCEISVRLDKPTGVVTAKIEAAKDMRDDVVWASKLEEVELPADGDGEVAVFDGCGRG